MNQRATGEGRCALSPASGSRSPLRSGQTAEGAFSIPLLFAEPQVRFPRITSYRVYKKFGFDPVDPNKVYYSALRGADTGATWVFSP